VQYLKYFVFFRQIIAAFWEFKINFLEAAMISIMRLALALHGARKGKAQILKGGQCHG
jgi:hypothetical protein